MRFPIRNRAVLALCLFSMAPCARAHDRAVALLEMPRGASFRFEGLLGDRIGANLEQWLLRAPRANPGMLDMFALRDRQPPPDLVPWAGEFVGKYLISAIQAQRMSHDARLDKTVRGVVDRLLELQADDGYLGPFPRDQRLLGNWDLWGHYHVMLALLMWHERTGDPHALEAARHAADLACKTYLSGSRRVLDAGSPEMNMGMIHVLARLYRQTGEPCYLELAKQIEQDFERAGDYLRTGERGIEFFRTPKPRWESLHSIQGLAELYWITGQEKYSRALVHHWRSIRRWDRHNSGAFSSGEQATGNPFAPGAIETCCTIAWMALTIDALRLTGESEMADELELSTYNAVAAAQHPAGSWWTYDTPMNGRRQASAHSIVFQARAGTPELNCCSVNGPRGLGMLSEWAVMTTQAGIAINFYGPMKATLRIANQDATLEQQTDYPRGSEASIRLTLEHAARFDVRLRMPAWSTSVSVSINGEAQPQGKPGTYLSLQRDWKSGDEIKVSFNLALRYEAGDLDAFGQASLYRGPLLLAYDQRFNEFDEKEIPALDTTSLKDAWLSDRELKDGTPWVLVEIPVAGAAPLRLCDFASAGALGESYRSWLSAHGLRPPPAVADRPADGAELPGDTIEFTWRKPAAEDVEHRRHAVLIAESLDFQHPAIRFGAATGDHLSLPPEELRKLQSGKDYYWKIVSSNASGESDSIGYPKRFKIASKTP